MMNAAATWFLKSEDGRPLGQVYRDPGDPAADRGRAGRQRRRGGAVHGAGRLVRDAALRGGREGRRASCGIIPAKWHIDLGRTSAAPLRTWCCSAPDGEYHTKKVPSTPADYAEGILDGAGQALGEHGVGEASVREVIHGTTVASNTVLENKGARTALITTRGFRDVLELRRLRVPHLYSLFYEPPTPLVPRRLRLEVEERVGAGGEVVRPLDEGSVHAAVERIRAEGADSVAVCLLHSYRNGDHERRVGEIVRAALPDLFCCLSVDVLAEIREYERTSTTVVNAYLGPIVQGYLSSLSAKTRSAGIAAPLRHHAVPTAG